VWAIAGLVAAALVVGVALASLGGDSIGDPAAEQVPVTNPPVTVAPTLAPTAVPQIGRTSDVPRNLSELAALLAARPDGYGKRTADLQKKVGELVAGDKVKDGDAEKLAKDVGKWITKGEIEPTVGAAAVNLLADYALAHPAEDDTKGKGRED
jgi:hypothetical protein